MYQTVRKNERVKIMSIVKPVRFDYETQIDMIEELCTEYPFISPRVLSRTCLGRSIFALDIGNKSSRVLLAAGFHGSEWIGCLAVLKFAERLSYCIKNNRLLSGVEVKRAFSNLGITIVPCVNPDGTEIAVNGPEGAKSLKKYVEQISDGDFSKYNANAKGVDINHNFNAGWQTLRQIEIENGITGPSSRQYGGEYPESEAETRAMAALCRKEPFRQVMAVHSQGKELYWQYGENTPAQAEMMAKILADSCSYTLVNNGGLASHGGFKDWFIDEFGRPGFTLEIGKGENPLPISDFPKIYARIEEAFLIFSLM